MSTVAPVQQTDSNFAFAGRSETLLSVTFLLTLVVLLIPLPTVILDMLLAVNLAGAILLLMVTLNARKPLDVSVFPSLLLLLTIFRLSLNVATTRLILLEGDAGKI
ncbi:MAG: flagellar biosynthesis protein FlhA, partial [Blastopirellula sp.]|nr:flagellar biosynthesis protein FlhA [Blastopirellula sp.]